MANLSDPLKSLRYRVRHRLTWLALLWEAFLSAWAPSIGVVLVALALGLLEVPQSLSILIGGPVGGWTHVTFLAATLIGFMWSGWRAVLLFRTPGEADIRRRIESTSCLEHRPLTALSDEMATRGDQRMTQLWEAFQRRSMEAQSKIRVGLPSPILPRLDPFAIRAALGLLLIIGLIVGWKDPGARLLAALQPSFKVFGESPTASIEIWISPPSYTGQPPILLTQPKAVANSADLDQPGLGDQTRDEVNEALFPVPIGSKVLAVVTGGNGVPELVIESDTSVAAGTPSIQAFIPVGADSHRLEMILNADAGMAVHQGGVTLSRWRLKVIPDLPPEIEFSQAPARTQRGSLMIRYEANDDHGLAKAITVIELLAPNGQTVTAEPIIIQVPVPSLGQKSVTGQTFNNLTSHAWAGLGVRVVLRAFDAIGQVGDSKTIEMILPERIFSHPVARAVIKQRKRLVMVPKGRDDVARIIMSIAARPDRYDHDLAVFLSLKVAATRLGLNEDGTEDATVTKILWDTALRIEDGELSLAARRLRELERQLQEALASETSDEKIEGLVEKLREAINEYLEGMSKQMRSQEGQNEKGQGHEGTTDALRRQDLQDMIDQMSDMAKTGAFDSAREVLSRLQEIMENMRLGQQQMPAQQRAMQEMLRQLGNLSSQQQQLMDDTYKNLQPRDSDQDTTRSRSRQGGQPNGLERDRRGMTGEHLARTQEQLRRQLGEFMRKLDEGFNKIPYGFGHAERAMKDAVGALSRRDAEDAIGPQQDALGQMQAGARTLKEMLREQMARGSGTPSGKAQGMQDAGEDEIDPLNRRRSGSGFFDRSTLGIPEELDVQKARRLFDELRRRSGERGRPKLELDYIERLLRRF